MTTPVISRPIACDVIQGLAHSRFLRATLLTGLSVGALFALYAAPPAWMVAAVAAGTLALALLAQAPGRGKFKMLGELGALYFTARKKHRYHKIIDVGEQKLFLGTLPNRLHSAGEHLRNAEEVGGIVALNEDWETEPMGLFLPYSAQDWRALGVENYHREDALDHVDLTNEQLNRIADKIHAWLREGKNVYIHCRAGYSRSAMAIAAYLIKYQNKSVDAACADVLNGRPIAKVMAKKEALERFKPTS